MTEVATILKALGHQDRLRILALLAQGDLAIGELTDILGLSQPRVTQYVKTLEQAGIIERLREGSWVFSRLSRGNAKVSAIVASVLSALDGGQGDFARDAAALARVREMRANTAKAFFAKAANDREALSAEYLPRGDVETALQELAGPGPFDFIIDLGTGTGRILELFSARAKRGSGLDSSADMLKVARARLGQDGLTHLSVRSGDILAAPYEDGAADLITLHQVLHFLDRPEAAIAEAARLLGAGGQVIIVDFAEHEREDFREKYAHRWLGFSDNDITAWLAEARLELAAQQVVSAQKDAPDVKLWRVVKPVATKGVSYG